MTAQEAVHVVGAPIVLLAGGASSSTGYYPGMSALAHDHRLVFFDRPGTGRAGDDGPATLARGAAALHEALHDRSCSPAVVVGHSLGGVAALQFGMTYPEDVAALVLLDPTPVNDAKMIKTTRALFRVVGAVREWPVIGRVVDRMWVGAWRRSLGPLDEEAEQCMHAMVATSSSSGLASALSTILDEAETLLPALRPQSYPIVIVTADRKSTSRIARAHAWLADRTGADLQVWPSTVHALHLQQPDRVAALVRELATAKDDG